MATDYSPPDLPKSALREERASLAGTYLLCVSYGMLVMLYLGTAQLLLKRRLKHSRNILIYITILFVLATVATGCSLQVTTWEWVDNRNYPGGPVGFSFIDGKNPLYLTMLMAYNLMSFMQDGWLLYRFLMIWNFNWLLFIFPCLLYLSSMATSTLMWVQILISGAPFLSDSHVNLGFITWVLTIVTNLLLTVLIIFRIFLVRLQTSGETGRENIRPFMSVASMLVESQAIYTAIGLIVLIGLKTNGEVVSIFANTFGIMEAFAPTLVAYRVANGTAWSSHYGTGTLSTFNVASISPSFVPSFISGLHTRQGDTSTRIDIDTERGLRSIDPDPYRDFGDTTSPTAYAPSSQSMLGTVSNEDVKLRDSVKLDTKV